MRNSLEMPVACYQREVVFERNLKSRYLARECLRLICTKISGVVFRRLPAREEHGYGRDSQESLQQGFVAVPLSATLESSLDLA